MPGIYVQGSHDCMDQTGFNWIVERIHTNVGTLYMLSTYVHNMNTYVTNSY